MENQNPLLDQCVCDFVRAHKIPEILFDLLRFGWWSGCAPRGTDLACNITNISQCALSNCLFRDLSDLPSACTTPASPKICK